ncbi:hypothetical protein SLA2020_198910 [Shorea laevis]
MDKNLFPSHSITETDFFWGNQKLQHYATKHPRKSKASAADVYGICSCGDLLLATRKEVAGRLLPSFLPLHSPDEIVTNGACFAPSARIITDKTWSRAIHEDRVENKKPHKD